MDETDYEALMQGQRNELAAWRDMATAAPRSWAQAHGLTFAQRAGGLAIGLRDLPVGMFNRAFGLGDAMALTQDDVAWALEAVPHHKPWMQPTPGEYEGASMALLAVQGFKQLPMRWVKVHRPLAGDAVELPPAKVSVRELAGNEGALFGGTLGAAMGLPPWMPEWSGAVTGRPGWHTYVASDAGGQVIGCAAMFIHERSAWLGMAATLPAARNQGAQRALMLRRLRDAQQHGATSATVETGEPMPGQPSPSFHNMLGCGFQVCGYRTNWVLA
ncbi:MAG: GNAT family N-acetyltransferase [Burkholderiales bacterium]|nr:GNAT family N-acetyltransferase [Burkholderiales bacterium]